MVVSPTVTTTYTVTGTNTAGCLSSNTVVSTVTVAPVPVISTSNYTLCANNALTLTASGAVTYTYSGGSNVVTPTINTTYSVTGTNSLGCISPLAALIQVTVLSLPNITVTSGVICSGQVFSISANGADTYSLNGIAGISNSFTVNPTSTTSYSITGTSTAGCTNTVASISTVTVFAAPVITAPNGTICEGNSFTISPSGANSYTFSSGSAVVNPSITSSYTVEGTSTVGCIGTASTICTVTVFSIPSVTVNSGTICSGEIFTIVPSGASTYSINGSVGSFTVNPLVNTTYSITGTSSDGCASTLTSISTVSVNTSPTISANSGSICNGAIFTLTPTGADTYSINGLSTSIFTLNPSSSTNYSVTGGSTAGCLATNTVVSTVSVFALPTLTVSSGSICVGDTYSISVSGATTYSINNVSTSVFTVSPITTTNYSISGTSSVGCNSTVFAISDVTVNAIPTITVNNGAICSGQIFTLIPGGANTYSVNGISTTVFTVNPISNTIYTLSGTSSFGCNSTLSAISDVTVNTSPTVAVNSGSICSGDLFTLTPTGADTYSINGVASTVFTVNPLITTSFSVTGSNTTGCTSNNTAVSTITVFALPTITVNSGAICDGQTFTLIPGGANSYSINGIGTTAFTVNPNATTSYSLTGSNSSGCSNTISVVTTITVNALPSITTNSGSICSGETFTIVPGGAQTYSVNGIQNNFTVTPLVNTTYSVSGTNSLGCTSTLSALSDVTVNLTPSIGVNSGTICEGSTFTMTPSGANTYSINGVASTNFTVNPIVNTTYTISGTSVAGCISTLSAISDITVHATPSIVVNSGAICDGQSFTITPTGASSFVITGGTFVVTPTVNSTYSVSGTSSAGCASTIDAIATITVNSIPSLTVNSGAICVNDVFTITPSGANTYSINGTLANSFTVNPTITSSYSVSGTSTAGCTSTIDAVSSVTVNNLPNIIGSTSKSVVCLGDSAQFNATGANTYTWSNGVSNTGFFTPTITSTYSVTGTDLNACVNSTTVSLVVNALPQLTVTSSNPLTCDGETFTLSVSGASTYVWATNSQTTSNITVSLTTTSLFTVSGTDANGCVTTATIEQLVAPCSGTIAVISNVIDVSCRGKNDGKVTISPIITFTNNQISYFWSPPELCPNNNCNSVENLKAGTYSVTVKMIYTVTPTYVKQDSVVRQLVVLDEKAPCDLTVFTGVSPNNDGVNDAWIIENIQLYPKNKVIIFNRWGSKVAEIEGYNNIDKAWPNTNEIDKLPASTYFYLIDLGDGNKPVKGWLELMKE